MLVATLRAIEYRYLVLEHSLELYGGLVAAIFAALGVWLGLKLTRPMQTAVREVEATPSIAVPAGAKLELNAATQEELGITKRELEILELIAQGLSTREIADRAFVSENTVKTHSSRLFEKLGAKRRTQAVQVAKARGLIR